MVGILQNEAACFRRTQGAGNVPINKSDASIASSASTNESSSSESTCSGNPSEANISESPHSGPDPHQTNPVKDSEEVSSTSTSIPTTKTLKASTSSLKDENTDEISPNDASLLRRSVSESAAAKFTLPELTVDKCGPSDKDDGSNNAFPSLPNSVLRHLGLQVRNERETFSENDIENRFISMALAFKTDVLTLSSRLDLQKRQRDQAEINMASEAARLKTSLYNLSRVYIDSDCVEALAQIQLQVDILQQATHRVSGAAELFGAVQQEHRLSRATEVLVAHVENTKLTVEKMNGQLEELKRVLAENNIVMEDNPDGDEPAPRTLRYRSLAAITAKKLNAKRRASIAALPRPVAASLEAGRSLSNLLEPRPKSSMANIVNSMRMKTTLSTITALASSSVGISEWQEKAEEVAQTEKLETTVPKTETATAVALVVESEVNNNQKEVEEIEQESVPEDCLPVLTPPWRESRHFGDESVYEETVNPLQYLRDGCQRIVVDYKQAALTYVQRNKTELLKKIRFYIASALFAAAGWFLIWIIIPTSEATPNSPQITW